MITLDTPETRAGRSTPAFLTAVVLICLLCGWNTPAQNLIVNGDFSTGNLAGWTTPHNPSTTITFFTTDTLKPRTVCYWRVNQVTEEGVIEGEGWRFRTQEGQ